MPYHDDERRRTGPFGYPLDDPAALTLEEREATQGTAPPAIADPGQRAEYIELSSQIAEAESALAANEALAGAQERDLRNEGVTPYEAARVTGKLREEAKSATRNLAGMRARQAKIEATAPPPASAGISGLPGEAAQAGAFHLPGAGLPSAGLPATAPSAPAARDSALSRAAGLPPITAPAIGQALDADAPKVDGVANTPVNRNQPPPVTGGALGGALNPLGGSLPPVNAKDHAEYTELNSQIAKAEAKLAADEALADAQERDLRSEGVTPYESARVTGKLREEARTAKFNIANMRTRKREFEATMKPPARDPQGASIIQAHQTTQTFGLSGTLLGGSPFGTGTDSRAIADMDDAGLPGQPARSPRETRRDITDMDDGGLIPADPLARNGPATTRGLSGLTGEAVESLDRTFMPAGSLDEEKAAAFRARTGYGLARGDGGFVLSDASGRELFDLAEDAAAELARTRDPDVLRRAGVVGILQREDIPPAEKRRLIEREIYRDVPEALRGAQAAEPDWMTMEGGDPTDFRVRVAAAKLKAYDTLEAALESGASAEQIGDHLNDFQAAMLPELFGSGRFVRELVMDMMPGLGNIRSVRHLQNDFAELDRAIETGEWGDAAMASGMAVLDAVGIFPGVNVVKGLARGAVKAIPRASSLLAERSIRRLARQWGSKVDNVDPKRFFGDAFDELPPDLQKRIKGLTGDSVGRVSDEELLELGKRMNPGAGKAAKKLPDGQGFRTKTRIYDLEARLPSEVLAEKSDTLGRVARWVAGAGDEIGPASKAEAKQFELKTGGGSKSTDQRKVDRAFRENPDIALPDHPVNQIVDLRKAPDEVSINSVIEDLTEKLDTWVSDGSLPRDQANALQLVMRQMQAKGIETVRLEDYAGLLARLGAAAPRRLSSDGGAIPDGPMGMS